MKNLPVDGRATRPLPGRPGFLTGDRELGATLPRRTSRPRGTALSSPRNGGLYAAAGDTMSPSIVMIVSCSSRHLYVSIVPAGQAICSGSAPDLYGRPPPVQVDAESGLRTTALFAVGHASLPSGVDSPPGTDASYLPAS